MNQRNCQERLREVRAVLAAERLTISRMRGSILAAMNELGVPQPGYPAPVAVAHALLTAALEEA